MPYNLIANYGVIGDLHSVALVGIDGSIDFMCFPEFDSPSIFAALLDHQRGGRFLLAPVLDDVHHKQLYLSESNILFTRFLSEVGVAEVSDFMPVDDNTRPHRHDLVRRVKTIRGEVRYRMEFQPRFDYARVGHRVEMAGSPQVFCFIPENGQGTALRLRSSVPLEIINGDGVAEFTLRTDDTATFVMEEAVPGEASPSTAPDFVPEAFKTTLNFWRQWIGRCNYKGRWREVVHRSALILKLLTSARYGAIVAAPTFGLPEVIGGTRNWDYRFTWIRDASFTLYALIRLGYTGEAHHFMEWIEARCGELNPDGSLQIMYGLDGHHDLSEEILPHFEGYQGSSTVKNWVPEADNWAISPRPLPISVSSVRPMI